MFIYCDSFCGTLFSLGARYSRLTELKVTEEEKVSDGTPLPQAQYILPIDDIEK